VNAMDAKGDTPLHLAVIAGSHAVVALLLSRNADGDRENKAGMTPRAALDAQLDQTLLIARALDRGDPAQRQRRRAAPP
jgi:ankyrin repeat protein